MGSVCLRDFSWVGAGYSYVRGERRRGSIQMDRRGALDTVALWIKRCGIFEARGAVISGMGVSRRSTFKVSSLS